MRHIGPDDDHPDDMTETAPETVIVGGDIINVLEGIEFTLSDLRDTWFKTSPDSWANLAFATRAERQTSPDGSRTRIVVRLSSGDEVIVTGEYATALTNAMRARTR